MELCGGLMQQKRIKPKINSHRDKEKV